MMTKLDILIDITKPVKLDFFDLVALEQELSEQLNTPVDLIIKSSLKPGIKETILSEVFYL